MIGNFKSLYIILLCQQNHSQEHVLFPQMPDKMLTAMYTDLLKQKKLLEKKS